MRLLVCGCIHGRYKLVSELQTRFTPDLTILLGDLQAFEAPEDVAQSSASRTHEIPFEYAEFSTETPIVALFGNHERFQHCAHESCMAKRGFLVAGTNSLKVILRGRMLLLNCLSGITNTNHRNPYYLGAERLDRLQYDVTPHYVLSHQWPDAAIRCNKERVSRAILQSHRENACDSYLQRGLFNQQLVWLAAHMHLQADGHIYEKQKCSIKFIALERVWMDGGYTVLETEGSKSLDAAADGIYIWNAAKSIWEVVLPF